MQYRDKYERVQLPKMMDLNAENSVLIRTMEDLKCSNFVRNRKEFSVRTYYSDNRKKKSPHLVTTTKKNLFRRAPKMFRNGLWLIVANKIDAKDCEFRGTIWIDNMGKITVEIAHGPGTVRTVTNDGVIDESHVLPSGKVNMKNTKLRACVRQCRNTHLQSVIFEFSYYKIRIGHKNEQFICWEITDDGTHQCCLFKE